MDAFVLDENAALRRQRVLAEYDLDYRGLQEEFAALTMLATQIAGTAISMVNLLDAYESWTVAQQGFELSALAIEDTVCAYTVQIEKDLEITSLITDERFAKRDYVALGGLNYYYGVPLTTEKGCPVGTLCVFDKEVRSLDDRQKSMLQNIAKEVMARLELRKQLHILQLKQQQLLNDRRIIAHDIRGPVAGMIGLAQLINDPEQDNSALEKTEYVNLIEESGRRVLELADEILNEVSNEKSIGITSTSLNELKNKFRQLFMPRVTGKHQQLEINVSPETADFNFSLNNINQIIGNLISNAIKFTPGGGRIDVSLLMLLEINSAQLTIKVADNGSGISAEKVAEITSGRAASTSGTQGESGYGLGLKLVKELVDQLCGSMEIDSKPGKGTIFKILIPVAI